MGSTTDRDSTAILTARLLGQVSPAVGARPIAESAWPPRGGRELLLLLLATPGHRLSRDRVLDTLWPDLTPDAARNAYYKALHSLRHTLEPTLPSRQPGSFIVATAETIAIAPGSVGLDVDVFEALVERAKGEQSERRMTLLRDALAIHAGDLMGSAPVSDWVTERREQLHLLWQSATLQLADLEVTRGNPHAAVARLDAIVAAEPTNEAAHRLLIRADDRAGQRDLAPRQYEQCVAVMRDELEIDPSPETTRIAAALLDPELPSRSVRRGDSRRWRAVPAPTTRLIGREEELDRLHDLIGERETRLLTLIGPGGVGKTRLAIETAIQLEADFADGVCFVPLAGVRESELVAPSIARALGVRDERDVSPLEQIGAVLRDRKALLLLDNFEHVRAAAPVAAEILAACPGVTMLTTSREPLHLRGERLVEIPPLAVPDVADGSRAISAPAVLGRVPAVTLFVERAAAVAPGFALTSQNAADVARICGRLDGLPLAIELAAARTRELLPHQLLALLDRRLATLVDGYHDLPERQRTMRDTIAWSHDLLDADLQPLFRRLAIFAGGSTIEIAARVVGIAEATAAQRLQALIDRNLMRWQPDAEPPRAEMLETTREFGLERLEAAGETAAAHEFLVTFATDLTAAAADHLAGPDQGSWLDRLDAEHDNLREALA